jgi:hypothetical protein
VILSHRWRCIFIKGRKVAGTSVEMALSTLCGPDDIVTPITARDDAERFRMGGICRNYAIEPADEDAYRAALSRFNALGGDRYDLLAGLEPGAERYYNHMSLRDLLRCHGGDLSGYRVFCVERSPYSKAMSFANMHASYGDYAAGRPMRVSVAEIPRRMDAAIADGSLLRARNLDLYRGPDGKLAATVLRYADLAGDLAKFLAGLGAPMPRLPHAKRGLLSDRLDPREVLRPDQISLINEMFEDDFVAFGYPMLGGRR